MVQNTPKYVIFWPTCVKSSYLRDFTKWSKSCHFVWFPGNSWFWCHIYSYLRSNPDLVLTPFWTSFDRFLTGLDLGVILVDFGVFWDLPKVVILEDPKIMVLTGFDRSWQTLPDLKPSIYRFWTRSDRFGSELIKIWRILVMYYVYDLHMTVYHMMVRWCGHILM